MVTVLLVYQGHYPGNFTPAKIAQRDWLEASQKEHAGGKNAEAAKLEGALARILEAMRREEDAAAAASSDEQLLAASQRRHGSFHYRP